MRGPPRTPLAMLQMRGSTLPRKQGRVDVPHVDGDIECPEWLGAHGRAKWAWLYPKLRAVQGLMKPAYADALAAYCDAFDVWMQAVAIMRGGLLATSEKGAEYQHPAVGIARRARADVVKLGSLFGLNPADATRVTGVGGEDDDHDPFAGLGAGEN